MLFASWLSVVCSPVVSSPVVRVDFPTRLETLFSEMLDQEGVRLPGDRRVARRVQAGNEGVSISGELHKRLLDYC